MAYKINSVHDFDITIRILKVFDDEFGYGANREDLYWRTDGGFAPVTFFVSCNDFFDWACADAEHIHYENIHLLEEAKQEIKNIIHDDFDFLKWIPELFACKSRNLRPQGACYKHIPKEIHHLFDMCGPEREININNPQDRFGEYKYKKEV